MEGDPFAGGEWCCFIVIAIIVLIALARNSGKAGESKKNRYGAGDENDYPFEMDD